jgi:predicted nucleic acid-binding Zn ribbon protein
MPIKEFECTVCKARFEVVYQTWAKYQDDLSRGVYCGLCVRHGRALPIISRTSPPKFNGSGFYETDYRGKG